MKARAAAATLLLFPFAPIAQDNPAKVSQAQITAMHKKVGAMGYQPFCVALGQQLRKRDSSDARWEMDKIMAARAERDYQVVSNDHGHIRARSLRIGMHGCGVLAALGNPSSVNSSTYTTGERHQLVFDSPRRFYVYLERDRVTSWQESR